MTTTPDATTSTSLYQRLRGHLATLKLHDAAEALPSVLDRAQKDGLSMTATLEQLLSIEVDATEARRLAGRLRFACLPTPASLDDFDYDAAPGIDRARPLTQDHPPPGLIPKAFALGVHASSHVSALPRP